MCLSSWGKRVRGKSSSMEDIPSEEMKLLATDPRFAIALEIIGHGGVEGKETPTPFRQRSADMS